MERTHVVFPSPTPPQKEESAEILQLNAAITAICKIYRSTTAKIQITAFMDSYEESTVIILSELPDELREGLHNYATRLIGEKHQLKAQSLIKKL